MVVNGPAIIALIWVCGIGMNWHWMQNMSASFSSSFVSLGRDVNWQSVEETGVGLIFRSLATRPIFVRIFQWSACPKVSWAAFMEMETFVPSHGKLCWRHTERIGWQLLFKIFSWCILRWQTWCTITIHNTYCILYTLGYSHHEGLRMIGVFKSFLWRYHQAHLDSKALSTKHVISLAMPWARVWRVDELREWNLNCSDSCTSAVVLGSLYT